MNTIGRLSFCCLAVALTITGTSKTVPQLINYQGKLSDAQGKPLPDGDKSLTFAIYGSAAGTDAIWGPQTLNIVPVVQGYFNVVLGPVDMANRALADSFAGPERYIEIKVGNDTISPRQRILSAPFAFRADSARTVSDGAISNRHIGNLNQLSASDGNPQSAIWVDSVGNVGIGTEDPKEGLHVNTGGGGILVTGPNAGIELAANSTSERARLTLGATDGADVSGAKPNDTILAGAPGGSLLFGLGSSEKMRITTDGHVGIGTANVDDRLHIHQGDRPVGLRWERVGYPTNRMGLIGRALTVQNLTDGRDELVFDGTGKIGIGTTSPEHKLTIDGGGLKISNSGPPSAGDGLELGSIGDQYAWIQSRNTRPVVLQPLGNNVGIGVTNPVRKLEVAGRIAATNFDTTSDRNAKTEFQPIDHRSILDKVDALSIETWRFTNDPVSVRHIGPVAQDFKAAFNLGHDDKHISTVDLDGVALAAIKGLNSIVKQQAAELQVKNQEIKSLGDRLARLERLLKHEAARRN